MDNKLEENYNISTNTNNKHTMSFPDQIYGDDTSYNIRDTVENERVWIFGYGSILWKTGFTFKSRRVGYVTGFTRRFWQGNTTHRGTKDKPGRVATLIPVTGDPKKAKVWGVAYELVGQIMIRQAMDHLFSRECQLGGYVIEKSTFYTQDCNCEPLTTLFFRATPQSTDYLGPGPEVQLAAHVIDCEGPSGHNIEYVILLSMYIQKHIPQGHDTHLSMLDMYITDLLVNRGQKLNQFVRMDLVPDCELFENCCSKGCSINNDRYFLIANTNNEHLSNHRTKTSNLHLSSNGIEIIRQTHSIM